MRILLADRDQVVRNTFSAIVAELVADALILEASDRAELLTRTSQHPDVSLLIVEFTLARTCGLLSGHEVRNAALANRTVVLSAEPCPHQSALVRESSGLAYVPINAPRPVIQAAMQIVLAGGRYFPPELLLRSAPSVRGTRDDSFFNLTPRQTEVLELMSAGSSNKAIARALGMSPGTVKVHVTAILKALNARNRTEAAIAIHRYLNRAPTQERRVQERRVAEARPGIRIYR